MSKSEKHNPARLCVCGGLQRKWNAWGTGRLIRLLLWRQASIYWCYSLIWFTWLLGRPVLPVGKVSCVWWMLLSEMPRSICDTAANKKKKKRGDFLILKVLPMYHQVCNLTLLPSVITFSGRTTAACVLMGWRWSLKRVMALQRRGPCHSWQWAGILLTPRQIWKWSCTVWHEHGLTIISWFEQLNRGATVWQHALCARAISWYTNHHVNRFGVMK